MIARERLGFRFFFLRSQITHHEDFINVEMEVGGSTVTPSLWHLVFVYWMYLPCVPANAKLGASVTEVGQRFGERRRHLRDTVFAERLSSLGREWKCNSA